VKEICPHYGYLRVKWNIAKGFRFDIKSEKEDEWVLVQKHSVPSNSSAPQSQQHMTDDPQPPKQ